MKVECDFRSAKFYTINVYASPCGSVALRAGQISYRNVKMISR